jgi:ubiquinone/menaquinone biosynthesis C-methylase UbiE
VAALEQARIAAYPPGEYVGQEGFMGAGEIRNLAARACIGPETSVLDLCCGVAGPGRLIVAERRCRYLGLDLSGSAVELACEMAGVLPCRFEQAHVPPLPDGRFEVVLLLETMLAFPDKGALFSEVARVLVPGGRFACTVEEGRPLSLKERAEMPDADTVWLIGLGDMTSLLEEVGLSVTWQRECTVTQQATATALLQSFRTYSAEIVRQIGTQALDELIAAHQLWSHWLGSGRVRKFALVAERR